MVTPFVRRVACSLVLVFSSLARAIETASPRKLTFADSAEFYEITSPTISRDGRWLATVEMPQEGDGTMVVRELDGERRWHASAGATPPPPFPQPVSPTEKRPSSPQVTLAFTGDSQFLITHALPAHAEQVAARIDQAAKKPGRPLLVTTLGTGEIETLPPVKSVQVPGRGGSVFAYLTASPVQGDPPPDEASARANAAPQGDMLVVRELAGGRRREIPHVTDFTLARDGRTLVYVAADGLDHHTLAVLDPTDDAEAIVLQSSGETVSKLTWDAPQSQLAFVTEDKTDAAQPRRRIQLWIRGESTVRSIVDAATAGVPDGMIVSTKAGLSFTPDGRKLLLGVAPPPPENVALPADPEERVDADIWSWNDDLIQPRQEVLAEVERDRSYRAVVDLTSGHYTQIGTVETPDVLIADEADRALAIDYRPYYRLRDYDGTYADIEVLDLATGGRRRVLTKLRGGTGDEGSVSLLLSPDGRHAAYYADRQWHLLELDSGATRSLTADLPVPFYNELHDQPEPAPWTEDSAAVLLYDRYDLWEVFLDDRAAQNLTHGYGRAHGLVLRRQDFSRRDEDEPRRGVDLAGPLTVRGEDEHDRSTGFLRFATGAAEPRQLLWRACAFSYIGRAAEADRLLLTASRFDEFPDVWVTDEELSAPRRVTDGQSQLAAFKWGHAEMMDYTNSAGVPLQAALYLPADFNPAKKYPLIVYTYERLSQIVHRFFPPIPGSNISFPIYTSNGYIVMLADIAYTAGQPGADALDCIHAALDAVEARGYVDENAIGYQGSSWGGYTAAYLLTHSPRFAALEGGAIVSNMTSAYGGIRLYSGQPRLFQYEQSQSRIGPSLAAAPERYLENSPLFQAQQASAPFLILHNDRDGAVPFSQSVEFFLSLRRHDKPVWLFNYRQDGHGVSRLSNRKDFSKRMWQFFDHYLRGAPAPDWLKNGVSYLDREQEKLRFNDDPAG